MLGCVYIILLWIYIYICILWWTISIYIYNSIIWYFVCELMIYRHFQGISSRKSGDMIDKWWLVEYLTDETWMGSANSQCSKPRLVDDSLGDKKLPNILDIIIIHELRIRFLTNQYNGMTEGFEHCVKSQLSQIHIRAGGRTLVPWDASRDGVALPAGVSSHLDEGAFEEWNQFKGRGKSPVQTGVRRNIFHKPAERPTGQKGEAVLGWKKDCWVGGGGDAPGAWALARREFVCTMSGSHYLGLVIFSPSQPPVVHVGPWNFRPETEPLTHESA